MTNIFLFLIGLCAAVVSAAGLFAIITTVGIINRFAQKMHSAKHIILFEECVIWGAVIGNVWYLSDIGIKVGSILLFLFAVVAGIYVGCLAIALAEVIKAIPVFAMRTKLSCGFGFVILAFAFGKGIGGIIYGFLY